MIDEFNSRVDVQRRVISILNSRVINEPIFGLSKGAIERWILTNKLAIDDYVVKLVYEISEGLFFLASQSQQQIDEKYLKISNDISLLVDRLEELWQDK